MNIEGINLKKIDNLSREEKRELVRKLIHSEAADIGVSAAFFNSKTKESMDMKGLVERVGEERAIDIIVEAIDSGSSKVKSIDVEDLVELREKAKRGECTEAELALLDFVNNKINDTESMRLHFSKNLTQSTISLIDYTRKNINFNPKLEDVLSACAVLVIISGMFSNNSGLSKYTPNDFDIVSQIITQIQEDIYDTWKASCESLPDPELIVASLLQLATRIAIENKLELSDMRSVSDAMNIPLFSDEDEEDDDTENGSNESYKPRVVKPTTYNHSSDDEDMRDLLKD